MKTYNEQLESAIREYLDYEIENKTFDASRGYDELLSIYDYEMRYNEVCSPVGDVDEDMVAANHDLLIEAGGNDNMDAYEADTCIRQHLLDDILPGILEEYIENNPAPKKLYLIDKKVGDKYSYAFNTDDIEETGWVDGVDLDMFMERDEAEKLLAELQAYCDKKGYNNVVLWLEAFEAEQLYREMFEGMVARHHTGEAFCIEGEAGDELIAFLVEHRPRMLNTNDLDDARLIDPESLDIAAEDAYNWEYYIAENPANDSDKYYIAKRK